jgi:hypothetical protein
MARRPTDRLEQAPAAQPRAGRARTRAKPEVYLTVAGQKFKKPDLDVYFAEAATGPAAPGACTCDAVDTVCSCNKVCTCNPQGCGCVGYTSCGCQSYTAGGGSVGGWCSCNKVCSCVPVH